VRCAVALLGVVAMLAACSGDGDPATAPADRPSSGVGCELPAGRTKEELPAVRGRRTVVIDVPADAADHPVPAVVLLHAAGGSPQGMAELTGFPSLGERDGVVVVSAEGSLEPKGWVTFTGEPFGLTYTETPFLVDLLDHLDATGCVDADRTAVVGLSNGAAMALLFACEEPGRVHAVVAVAGLLWPGDGRCSGDLPPKVGVWLGTEDRVFEGFLEHTPHGCCGNVLVWPPDEIEATWRAHVPGLRWESVPGGGHEWPDEETEVIWDYATT
jgi:polyhydroxybutyrate depolymerase